jgi:hypothetical protein
MAEPTGVNYPTSYDDVTTLLGDLIDQRNFTLLTGITDSQTVIDTVGSVEDVDVPVYLLFTDGTDEIVFAESIAADGLGFEDVVRGARGTTNQIHTAGAGFSLILSGKHFIQMRDAIIQSQEHIGLVGLDANKAASPVVNEVYVATDTNRVYVCLVAGSWTWIGNRDDHADLDGLADDDHNQYHNDARALTWHDGLTGGHVQGGDTHDHGYSDVLGAGRVQNGASGSRTSVPTYVREIYYETDTELLYISKGNASSGDWVRIVGAPVGTVAPFLEADLTTLYSGACPPGWTRETSLDSRYAKGAPTGVTSPLNTGGSLTHTHDYTDVVPHTHTVPTWNITLQNDIGTHSHSIKIQGGGSGGGLKMTDNCTTKSNSVEPSGNHNHDIDTQQHSTDTSKRTSDDGAGVATGTTDSASSEPPYQEIVWCRKT